MNAARINFQLLPWVDLAPGAREKRVAHSEGVLRLVEFSPPFIEDDWCVKGHCGYVLDGQFSIQFGDRVEILQAGDGILIPAGQSNAHKAIVQQPVLLLLMERGALGEP
ncbi:Cupin domain protein [Rubripirellula tenax]|uniref:Cupin domain protein n=1 Tax=Rubripirellula tenax TaxID=2528015 RepID=A0A5C6FEM6_9BACT|nr:cupin domain-containing protein [Rubripirellula tenax]TWU59951.1 Cupin domain protein [Rubripirellula tenax]